MGYLTHDYPSKMVSKVAFRPFEDVLAVGHSTGVGTLIVPGAGFANYDAFEANPFETKKQARESEVRKILEKLQPDTIMLDPHVLGQVNSEMAQVIRKEAEKAKSSEGIRLKKKMRGKHKAGKRQLRIQKIKETMRREKLKKRMEEDDFE